MPWRGGKEELVLERVHPELYRAWAIGRKGLYYTYKDPASAKLTHRAVRSRDTLRTATRAG